MPSGNAPGQPAPARVRYPATTRSIPRRCAIATQSKPAQTPTTDDGARAFAIEAARLAANTRCSNVVVLDVRNLSPITDYFVLATGTSPRQMRTACDDVAELGRSMDFKPLSTSGYEGEQWMLADFVNVILHVFNDESRAFYDLDNLWGDAPQIDWRDGMPAPAGAPKAE